MSVREITFRHYDSTSTIGHVNLMVDTFIANASTDDLRSIVRNLLATGPPGIVLAFSSAARTRLCQRSSTSSPSPYPLFRQNSSNGLAVPSPHLYDALARARALYGAGLGFTSLEILASVVRATVGLRWEEEGDMADILAVIDADVAQAIQSSKEEIVANRVENMSLAREAKETLGRAVQESIVDVSAWRGEFPFERASASLEQWRL